MSRKAKRNRHFNSKEERNSYNVQKENNNLIRLNFSDKKKKRVEIVPRSLSQEIYLEALEDKSKDIVFAVGPAGTGKTLIGTLFAIRALKNGDIDKIVISRPNVAVDDKDIGYLPGDIFEKMQPWAMPVLDIFAEYYTQKDIVYMIEEKIIEIIPVAFIRGRTLKNSIILIDEAQGTTKNSLLAILTRIGENSKMIITGDLDQSDKINNNGLSDFINRWEGQSDMIEVVQFGISDVERHRVIQDILRIYDK